MRNIYSSFSRHKYYLKRHVIFGCKYRKRLLAGDFSDRVKDIFTDISSRSDFIIEPMETDMDHIHMLVSYPPTISVSSIVRRLEQESTVILWKTHGETLRRHFWKERTFWSDGYFVCSIGMASPETVRKYIENQG